MSKSVKSELAKLGWDLYHEVEPREEVSPYAHKYERQEGHVRLIAGEYKAQKRVGDILRGEVGNSPEQLLERVKAWENREVQ